MQLCSRQLLGSGLRALSSATAAQSRRCLFTSAPLHRGKSKAMKKHDKLSRQRGGPPKDYETPSLDRNAVRGRYTTKSGGPPVVPSNALLDARSHPAFTEKPVGHDWGRNLRENTLNSNRFMQIITGHLTSIKKEHLNRHDTPPERYDEFAAYVQEEARAAILRAKGGQLDDDDDTSQSFAAQLATHYLQSGEKNLDTFLKSHYRKYVLDEQYRELGARCSKLLDFRYPAEWFPSAREMQRVIHLHVGPTNSGKTYRALKRLEESKSGFYAGPLRLLAHEVYSRLNAKGIPCGLITGDEVRYPDQVPRIFSNTVEMVPLGQEVEVGVIDEIQMIGDEQRGWAWTRAVLGARAKELHLCGEERTVPLIQKLAASTGDKVVVHKYERLNPLQAMNTSLKGKLSRLEKGDCVVSFSRLNIHTLKNAIEKATGRRCAIVYGSLPAEIRSQQADLFNDPDNDYDYLVASDAIGMGLNLSVKRIIFETSVKRLPSGLQRLTISQVKQIGGRAGRYRIPSKAGADTASENVGLVTCLEDVDLPYIQEALAAEAPEISRAGLLPLDNMIRAFADNFEQDTPFSYILQKMFKLARLTEDDYFMCSTKNHVRIGDLLDGIKSLTISDMLVFTAAPIAGHGMDGITRAFASCVANNLDGHVLDIQQLNLDILNKPVSDNTAYLQALEALHRALVLYLWLSFRSGGVFTDRALATHVKDIAEVKMDRALTEFSANRALRRKTSLQRQLQFIKQMQVRENALKASATPSQEDILVDEPETI